MSVRLTVAAARRSWGQAEIWSAGSKHQFTALKNSSRRTDYSTGSGPPRYDGVSGRPQPSSTRNRPRETETAHARPARPQSGSNPSPPQTRTSAQFSRRTASRRAPATIQQSMFQRLSVGGAGWVRPSALTDIHDRLGNLRRLGCRSAGPLRLPLAIEPQVTDGDSVEVDRRPASVLCEACQLTGRRRGAGQVK